MEHQPEDANLIQPLSLRLQLESDSRTSINLRLSERITIGRADEGEEHELGLNLAPYEAAQNGVSRVHAALFGENGIIYVEDLNSSNGTRINGFQVNAGRPYRLRDGDELEFGSLRLVVHFARSS